MNLEDYRRKEYSKGTEKLIVHAETQWRMYVITFSEVVLLFLTLDTVATPNHSDDHRIDDCLLVNLTQQRPFQLT